MYPPARPPGCRMQDTFPDRMILEVHVESGWVGSPASWPLHLGGWAGLLARESRTLVVVAEGSGSGVPKSMCSDEANQSDPAADSGGRSKGARPLWDPKGLRTPYELESNESNVLFLAQNLVAENFQGDGLRLRKPICDP